MAQNLQQEVKRDESNTYPINCKDVYKEMSIFIFIFQTTS